MAKEHVLSRPDEDTVVDLRFTSTPDGHLSMELVGHSNPTQAEMEQFIADTSKSPTINEDMIKTPLAMDVAMATMKAASTTMDVLSDGHNLGKSDDD